MKTLVVLPIKNIKVPTLTISETSTIPQRYTSRKIRKSQINEGPADSTNSTSKKKNIKRVKVDK